MKLKEIKTKYDILELMIDDEDFVSMIENIQILSYEKAIECYGEYNVLSTMNFNDSRTTSVILEKLLH